MALLDILTFPDPRLRNRAEPVARVDDEVRRLVDDMLETMYEAPGVGLAAVQVNVLRRVVVIDVSQHGDDPRCFINPEILERRGACALEEGCLSVPDVYEVVDRDEWIRVRALDREGEPFELEAEGLLAVCIQHEIEHLEGVLFVDHLSKLKRQRLRKKVDKRIRQAVL